ncbi:hypothetical protein MHIR_DE00258 [Candidatus Doolittlea endobia]|uniref:Uncharacterized protein n=1 Tax=Candidatus Doolittlea endobia TaxID=1778262 RepID=A0A143WS66_9ENTR|nr:hypothetical protein MHIR_DE00258 [Candidatus Doolittlea endobia]
MPTLFARECRHKLKISMPLHITALFTGYIFLTVNLTGC